MRRNLLDNDGFPLPPMPSTDEAQAALYCGGSGTPDTDTVAQAIWQTYAAEVGRSLPGGLANKLARAAIDAFHGPGGHR